MVFGHSLHSATVMALAVAIGLQEGTGGPTFAIAIVLACVVMYDASGLILHAGQQAELLNKIVREFPPEHPLSNSRPLRDSLEHTPLQVLAGVMLGCVVAYLMKNSNYVGGGPCRIYETDSISLSSVCDYNYSFNMVFEQKW
ncbi:uncharacterized protein LOC114320076 [Camellia sinensis]|uniref:uncharacterized protein LOC114320076 n=1 Tax=Camellia sinensis TaxID=4442 RepID=UPI0010361F2E|nr:uncharacterized protein LOC114320076 [Camellia sinensis]